MVPTHALLAAMAALTDPAPVPALSPPDDAVLAAPGEQMRFLHPVATNPYIPASQPAAHHTDQPKRNGGGGGRGGSGGSQGSGGSRATGTSSGLSLAQLAAALTALEAANGGKPTGSTGGTTGQPTSDPATPTVLPHPTDPTTALPTPTADLFAQSTAPTPVGGSGGVSPVVPGDVDPPANSPLSTPEPGTILLFTLAAGLGGSAAVRKWVRRKR